MRHINLWKAKLKAAKAQHTIATRQYNAAKKAVDRLNFVIFDLESKLERYLEKPKSKATKHD